MNSKNKFSITLIALFSLLQIFTLTVVAEEIEFNQAVFRALENNLDLREKAAEVENIKRDLALIEAQQNWSLAFEANYNEVLKQDDSPSQISSNNNFNIISQSTSGGEAELNLNRNFSSGLSVLNNFSIDDKGESDYNLSLTYPIFPRAPNALDKNYIRQSEQLLVAKKEYQSLKSEKIIDWTADYLQLIRLKANLKNRERSLKNAEINLKNTEEKKAINEAGELELLEAEIRMLETENSYQNLKNQLQNLKASFALNLRLEKEEELVISSEDKLLVDLKTQIPAYNKEEIDLLYQQLIENNNLILAQEINLKLKEKTLEWDRADSQLSLSLTANYNLDNEMTIIGAAMSYTFYDGGAADLEEEKLLSEIELAESSLEQLKSNLKINLISQLNNLETARRELKKQELSLSQAQLSFKDSQKKRDDSLIKESDFIGSQISFYNAQLNLKEAEDNLLIVELNLKQSLENEIIDFSQWRNQNE